MSSNITTRILYCRKCEGHGIQSILKNHDKCLYLHCDCDNCNKLNQKRLKSFEKRNAKQLEKAKYLTQLKKSILQSYPEFDNHPDAELFIAHIQNQMTIESKTTEFCKSCPPLDIETDFHENKLSKNNIVEASLSLTKIYKKRRRNTIPEINVENINLYLSNVKMDSLNNDKNNITTDIISSTTSNTTQNEITVPSTSSVGFMNRKRAFDTNQNELEKFKQCQFYNNEESAFHRPQKISLLSNNDDKTAQINQRKNEELITLPTIPPISVWVSEFDKTIKIATPKEISQTNNTLFVNPANSPISDQEIKSPNKNSSVNHQPLSDALGQPQFSTMITPTISQNFSIPTFNITPSLSPMQTQNIKNIMFNQQTPRLVYFPTTYNQNISQNFNNNSLLITNQSSQLINPYPQIQNSTNQLNFQNNLSTMRSSYIPNMELFNNNNNNNINNNNNNTQKQIINDLELQKNHEQALTSFNLLEQIQKQHQKLTTNNSQIPITTSTSFNSNSLLNPMLINTTRWSNNSFNPDIKCSNILPL